MSPIQGHQGLQGQGHIVVRQTNRHISQSGDTNKEKTDIMSEVYRK